MSRAEIISLFSLLVSLGAFSLAFYIAFRDKAKIVERSKFWPANEYGEASIRISVVNAGRRPIVLRSILAIAENGDGSGPYLGSYENGLRLGENELHQELWGKADLLCGPDDDQLAVDIQIEDSLGRRYQVKDARKSVAAMFGV